MSEHTSLAVQLSVDRAANASVIEAIFPEMRRMAE